MSDPQGPDASGDDPSTDGASGAGSDVPPEVSFDDVVEQLAADVAAEAVAPTPSVDEMMAGYPSCEAALEEAVTLLERVNAERDEYLDLLQRSKADFGNFKRRVEAERAELSARANDSLVSELLPVLDACEAAVAHGSEDVVPIHSSLLGTLEKLGLEPVADAGVGFDPNVHEAVMTEDGDGSDEGPVVADVMRTGYSWNGRVLRPAMVKVRS